MESKFIAHINTRTGQKQTVREHSENTAELCREYAIPELKSFLFATGLYHDVGKYGSNFQRRILGENIRVEHSACGALAAKERYPFPMCLMMEYCIAGHHSGLPNGGFDNDTEDMSTLSGRMHRKFDDFSIYDEELSPPEIDFAEWTKFITCDCGNDVDRLIDKFTFLTRYVFSCLVDADTKDTAWFCGEKDLPVQLHADFQACLEKVNHQLASFPTQTELQKARAQLQNQAFQNAGQPADIYLLNMPTGSGKTLASVRLALEMVISGEKKRIIYIIPYNSIIDQTAEVFENLFGEDLEILRHQSTFSYEDAENLSEDYREAAKCATENWDAPFIITTTVQFFESIYSNKRGKLRKLHNMADSILIFDEAHLMPQDYLQPCLQSIAYITRYLHSKAIFLTATMPDFRRLVREYAFPDSRIVDLITDISEFPVFQKCRYSYLGELESFDILKKSSESLSSLIVVNKRATARKLFQECGGKKYHLSTYMTAFDRKRVLKEIRQELKKLEEDYPDLQEVPEDRRITIISTSLIEAGVDLDVYTVFRETAGLDNILQAGGRCNREGKRATADVFIFELSDQNRRIISDVKRSLTKGLLDKYPDISAPDCIREYYDRLFFMNRDKINQGAIHNQCSDIRSIPFKTYAEEFEIIDTKTVSLIVARDEKSRTLLEGLKFGKMRNARPLQNYSCTLYQRELDDLIRQHAADDYGTGIFCLTNPDYYDEELGVLFEAQDYYL
ncbi:MAG: CRISPR-associated helicase Cas3' [Lachnospiraceae bacterium]|nr:CRISPR-associated helicase Cas3' [Lachnospiraceae bacterium]